MIIGIAVTSTVILGKETCVIWRQGGGGILGIAVIIPHLQKFLFLTADVLTFHAYGVIKHFGQRTIMAVIFISTVTFIRIIAQWFIRIGVLLTGFLLPTAAGSKVKRHECCHTKKCIAPLQRSHSPSPLFEHSARL